MKTRTGQLNGSTARMLLAVILAAVLAAGMAQPAVAATQIDIAGPIGSGAFGTSVTVLPNGNIVVTDPYYDAGAVQDVGAVYLYDGATGAQISMLTGSTAYDQVGGSPYTDTQPVVTVLSNGNYLVISPWWDNAAGAVTWGSATTGVSGVVSAANSLVGSTAGDWVGYPVTALSNGNYVVCSSLWDNGGTVDAGAVTWGNGTTGVTGVVSAANSLAGSTADDHVGCAGLNCLDAVTELSNGNYVVGSPYWDNDIAADAGAVTWGSGTAGVSGPISPANSLVGSTAGDRVGFLVTALANGNYLARSPSWDDGPGDDAGAVTWGDGTTGRVGVVSAANSLVGSRAGDQVGNHVIRLSNGNYLVRSPSWDNGLAADAGAVTWGSGTAGVSGIVSAANSLVGSRAGDQVGCADEECQEGVTELSNGNYVVRSSYWDNGATADAGAVTWGNGATGVKGMISAANSLVGSTAGDLAGFPGVRPLSNGNYVVCSPSWDNGAATNVGAVTWGNGQVGIAGVVSAANSLVGSAAGDQVGFPGVTALSNGNYVVSSYRWDDFAGAVTWGSGTSGVQGVVSAANSLVSSTAGDQIGRDVVPLSNGNYVVLSPWWNNFAGAVTWGNGQVGIAGVVSAANSLVGTSGGDQVGYPGVTALSNGNYVVLSIYWDNATSGEAGPTEDVGAVTWGSGTTGVQGTISAANSLVGSTAGDLVGSHSVTALSHGNYVVRSIYWSNGAATSAGAATWGNGMTGVKGVVSAANSLVGSQAYDVVGYDVTPLSNGNYVVSSYQWDNGPAANAGAVTWGSGLTGINGPITAENSVLGTAADGGQSMIWAYDPVHRQLVVGRRADNVVTLFQLPPVYTVFLPVAVKNAP